LRLRTARSWKLVDVLHRSVERLDCTPLAVEVLNAGEDSVRLFEIVTADVALVRWAVWGVVRRHVGCAILEFVEVVERSRVSHC
jgi:hypothetical protein